jgi:hypothetical protein
MTASIHVVNARFGRKGEYFISTKTKRGAPSVCAVYTCSKKQSPPVSDSRAVLHPPDKRETWVITCERMALICASRKKQNEKLWILWLTESVLNALHDKQSDAIQRHLAVPFVLGLGSQFSKE